MLTIFGKKKKDDSGVQIDTGTDAGQTPSQTPSMPPDPMQTQAPNPITSQNQPTTWPKQSVMGQTTPPPPPPSSDANASPQSNNQPESTNDMAKAERNGPDNSATSTTLYETNDPGTRPETHAQSVATRRVISFGRNLAFENPAIPTPRHPDGYRVHLQSNAGEHSRIRRTSFHTSQQSYGDWSEGR